MSRRSIGDHLRRTEPMTRVREKSLTADPDADDSCTLSSFTDAGRSREHARLAYSIPRSFLATTTSLLSVEPSMRRTPRNTPERKGGVELYESGSHTGCMDVLESFPARPLRLTELESLEEHARIAAAVYDDEMVDVEGATAYARNCVLITDTGIHAVVYIDEEGGWQRVHHAARPDAALTTAYDAVRAFHQNDDLFDRGPLSVSEAVYTAQRSEHEADEYAEGDEFACPVCDNTHIVQREPEPAYVDDIDTELDFDLDYLYVNCPEASNETLFV
jgi:hypothetical protein